MMIFPYDVHDLFGRVGPPPVVLTERDYQWAPCPKHALKPEINEGCGTVTCQECLRINLGAR
jgi:hypothetical protein